MSPKDATSLRPGETIFNDDFRASRQQGIGRNGLSLAIEQGEVQRIENQNGFVTIHVRFRYGAIALPPFRVHRTRDEAAQCLTARVNETIQKMEDALAVALQT